MDATETQAEPVTKQPENRGVVGAVKFGVGDLVRLSSDSKQYTVIERVAPRGVRVRQVGNPRVVKAVDERSLMLEQKGSPLAQAPLAADTEDPALHRAAVETGLAEDVPTADDGAATTVFRVSTADAERHAKDEAARVAEDAARVEELRIEAEDKGRKADDAERDADEAHDRLEAAEDARRALEASRAPQDSGAVVSEGGPGTGMGEQSGAGTDPTSKAPAESTGGTLADEPAAPAVEAPAVETPPAETPPAEAPPVP